MTVAELLAVLGSVVLLLTEAVSEKLAPVARLAGAETTRVNVSELPDGDGGGGGLGDACRPTARR